MPQAPRIVRALLFDLDGVLVDSYEAWLAVVQQTAAALGGRPVTRESFAQGWGQGIEADLARWFPGRQVAEVEAFYHAHFLDHRERLRFDADAAPVLAALRERGIPTALVTNTPGPLARSILATGNLVLDAVVGGTDVPRAKPAPDLVLRAAELLGVPPGEALMVGDTEFDRAAARAAGTPFAGLGIEGDVTLGRLQDVLDRVGPGCGLPLAGPLAGPKPELS